MKQHATQELRSTGNSSTRIGFVGWLYSIPPWAAFFFLNLVAAVLAALSSIVWTSDIYSTATVGLVIAYLGWPTLYTSYIARFAGSRAKHLFRRVCGVFLAVVLVHLFIAMNQQYLLAAGTSTMYGVILVAIWIVGFFGPMYILTSATVSLVSAESGRSQPLDRHVGTFLSFMFLPIGVLFLQRRARSLSF